MTWVEGDNLLVSGESLARQIEHGVAWSLEHLGVRPSVYMAPDNFGHTGNLPQLAVAAGAVAYFHMRCNPGVDDVWPAYWWEGVDGTRLLALSTPKYTGEITAGDLARAAVRSQAAGLPVAMHLHGLGDHGGGPARLHLETLRRLAGTPGLPTARCSTIEAVAAAVLAADPPLPVHRGPSATIFEGCYSSQRGTKARNRAGENALLTAEAVAAMADLDIDLDDAWRALLFNQFHDILAGSSIGAVHQEQAATHDRAQAEVVAVIDRSLERLAGPRADGASTFAVINPLGRARRDVVEVDLSPGEIPAQPVILRGDNGQRVVAQPTATGLCFVAHIPGWSAVIYKNEGPATIASSSLSVAPAFNRGGRQVAVLDAPDIDEPPFLVVDTPHLEAHIRRDSGIVAGLLDKRSGRQLVAYGLRRRTDYLDVARHDLALNVLQLVEERPHGMSAWQLGEVWRESTLLGTATTSIVESGPVRIVLEVAHELGRSSIRQRLSFYADLARIDAETDIDWQEQAGPGRGVPSLKVAFTASVPATEAWFETPFGAIAGNADGQEVAAQRWAWVGSALGGLAVANDSTYAHDALGGRLRLTLVRGSYSPDPGADVGRHQVRYSIIPTEGRWQDAEVVDHAAGFNQPLLARTCEPQWWGTARSSLRGVTGEGVGVSAVRRRGGDVDVALYDATGTGCHAGDGENGSLVALAPFEVRRSTSWPSTVVSAGREQQRSGE